MITEHNEVKMQNTEQNFVYLIYLAYLAHFGLFWHLGFILFD